MKRFTELSSRTPVTEAEHGASGANTPDRPDVCRPHGTADLPMLDIYMPMMKSSAIIAAVRLGLFEALADGALDLNALSARTGAQRAGLKTLADFLVSLGYLTKASAPRSPDDQAQGRSSSDATDCRYANTSYTEQWFTQRGEVDYSAGALWTFEAWSMMGELDRAVRDGTPSTTLWERMKKEPHLGALFSRYMNAFARHVSPDLVARVPVLASQTRLLDLGGSHGLHAIGFCRAHPQLSAVIVDLPVALTDTPSTIREAGMQDRIALRPGNILDLEWVAAGAHPDDTPSVSSAQEPSDTKFDIALYLCVAHNQSESDNARVIGQIAHALNPGGVLVIHDYFATESLNPYHAAFRLTLLYETGTRTYSESEYRNWLGLAGFRSVERIDLDPLEKGSILLAYR